MPLDLYFYILHITRTQITPEMKKNAHLCTNMHDFKKGLCYHS